MGINTILDHEHDWSTEIHPYRTTFDHLNERYAVEIRECQDDECDAKEWERIEVGGDDPADADRAPEPSGQQELGAFR